MKSTRNVTVTLELALAPDAKEMRQATLLALLAREVERMQAGFDRQGYTVDRVAVAKWESVRSDGRGYISGSLLADQ